MHTLNVGPMADVFFNEEVAMCFLRCRERHRMRTRMEEIRERKRMKRKLFHQGGVLHETIRMKKDGLIK